MDFSQLGLFNGLMGKMDWLVQRQKVLAENIANSDTPGYESKDISPFSFGGFMRKLMPAATEPGHIQLASAGDGDTREASAIRSAYEVKPDGNAVSTEQEMTKAAGNFADYQLASNVYKKMVGLIESAAETSG